LLKRLEPEECDPIGDQAQRVASFLLGNAEGPRGAPGSWSLIRSIEHRSSPNIFVGEISYLYSWIVLCLGPSPFATARGPGGTPPAIEKRRLGKIGSEWAGLPVAPRISEPERVEIMRRILRGAALASMLAIGGLVGPGTTSAQAQGFGLMGGFGGYPRGSYYGGGYGAGGCGNGFYGAGYGGGYGAYPAPLVGIGGFGAYGGYGGGGYYGGGYGGYSHHYHRHHHGCGH
jgi:hypothetical protein